MNQQYSGNVVPFAATSLYDTTLTAAAIRFKQSNINECNSKLIPPVSGGNVITLFRFEILLLFIPWIETQKLIFWRQKAT